MIQILIEYFSFRKNVVNVVRKKIVRKNVYYKFYISFLFVSDNFI